MNKLQFQHIKMFEFMEISCEIVKIARDSRFACGLVFVTKSQIITFNFSQLQRDLGLLKWLQKVFFYKLMFIKLPSKTY